MQNNKPIEIDGDCQFMQDLNNNATMARYNVIVVKGQLQLFSKGIKPNRHFRLKDIKRYFGITGNTETLINKIYGLLKSGNIAFKEDYDILEGKYHQLRSELDSIYKVLEMDALDIQDLYNKLETHPKKSNHAVFIDAVSFDNGEEVNNAK